ncbi:MAG: hypothetical protein QOE65_1442 [Solirubrobacteraceae bacterium]|jgi:hypothetical protein|nr:hypothetical protein [Solirubrobacteraceae bacterium]
MPRARRSRIGLLLTAVLAVAACAAAPAPAAAAPRALLVFVPAGSGDDAGVARLLRDLEHRPQLGIGLVSATQGNYSDDQALLDITSGIRVSPTAYGPSLPGDLRLVARGARGVIAGWDAAARRAHDAPATVRPGLLASAIPGGAAYAGVAGARTTDAAAAADRRGRVAAVSLGATGTLVSRTRALLRGHRLVVATVPGVAQLDAFLAARAPDELVLVMAQPPDARVLQFLPIAAAGDGYAGRGLTSDTTQRDGVVTGIDLAPTILRHLHRRVPGNVTGSRIEPGPRVSAADLLSLRDRYRHVAPRRIRTLEVLLAAWALLLAACALAGRARTGLRVGALAFLWVPVLVLVPGVVDPASPLREALLVAVPAFVLGALTDRLVAWPRAPLVPAVVTLVVYLADLATGSDLLTLSMLGPNPRAGARFYGVGNELEPTLPIMLFTGLAALFTGHERSRRIAAVFGIAGLALALAIGSGLLGADVGGVITGSVGAAVAALFMVPGHVRARVAAAVFVVVPVVAVGALALLDLLTGAQSHFARNVLEAHGNVSFWQTVQRRYEFAWHALLRGKMPFVFAVSAGLAGLALAYRDRLYARLPGPAWRAALAGGLAGGVAGALTNDSGPLLFVVAVFVLGVVTAYLHGGPLMNTRPGALHSEDASGSRPSDASPRPARVA